MEKKKSKEELIAAAAVNLKEKVDLQSADIDKRKALSWMLSAPFSKKNQYDYGDQERITYTWPQIYFEIGKLAASRNFMDFEGNVSELEVAVEQMKKNWEKYFESHPQT